MFIKLKDKDAGLSAEVKVAKMSMIDLAGSEKVNFAVRCNLSMIMLFHRVLSQATRAPDFARAPISTSPCWLSEIASTLWQMARSTFHTGTPS